MGIDYFLNLAHIGLVHGIIIYYIGLVFCHKKIFASKLLFFGLTMKQFVFNIMMVGISLTALSIALIIILPLCIPIVSYLLVFIDGLIH